MKKVLVISYYWPPAGGIGVHRCLKFVKYLPHFGWEPVVYAPLNAQYPYLDETNFKDIPEDITILKRKIFEPFKIFKFLSGRKPSDSSNPVYVRDRKLKFVDKLAIRIRGNFFIPDARSFWIRPSVRHLLKHLNENPVDAIITDGPPHTNTVIGCRLSQKTNTPLLADFQDPWTQVDYYNMLKIGKRADKKHHKLEQETFNTARKITIVSPTWKKDIESIGAKNVDVVYWGYDEEDFPEKNPEPDNEFSIVHAGQLGYDRKPDTFIRVLAKIKNENPHFADKLKIKFAGTVDFDIIEIIKKEGLEENLKILGNIHRPKALELCMKSHIQLLPLNIATNAKGRIPGKLFENMRAKRPILCLGPENSDVAKIIKKTNSGQSYEYDDFDGIKSFIIKTFEKYRGNCNIVNSVGIEEYDVKNQVKLISDYLNEIS